MKRRYLLEYSKCLSPVDGLVIYHRVIITCSDEEFNIKIKEFEKHKLKITELYK
jgi:hypothetical protein